MNTIGERLEFILNSKGLTQYAFCMKTGYNKTSLSRTIAENRVPNEKNLTLIIEYFDDTREWLINGIDPIYQSNINQTSETMDQVYVSELMETNRTLRKQVDYLVKRVEQLEKELENKNLGEQGAPHVRRN